MKMNKLESKHIQNPKFCLQANIKLIAENFLFPFYLFKNKKKVIFLTNAPRPCSVVRQFLLNLGMEKNLLQNIMSSGEASMKNLENGKFGKFFFHLGPDKDNEIFINFKKD